MEEYRIPTIEEFVPGFRFEVEIIYTGGFSIFDFANNTREDSEMTDTIIWSEKTFPNFNERFYSTKDDDGITWSMLTTAVFGTEEDYLKKVKELLLNNKIRCKV